MKKTLVAFLTVLTASVFPACGGGASAAGVYMLDKAAFKESMLAAMPAEAKKEKAAMDMIDSMVAGMNVTIELKADGTASATTKMDVGTTKKDETDTGTWKLDGTKLTVTTKDKAGKEESKTGDYANGSFSMEETQGGMKIKMTFKRK